MKLLELFCGAGSFSIGMKRNLIEHEIVGFSDIRYSAIKLFCKIHNKREVDNLGDIKDLDARNMKVDIITYGSPCQSFTRAGKGEGGEKGSNTKSSLMWEAVRVINQCKPKIVIWENVPDAINKKNINNFDNYLKEMDFSGYNNYYEVLDADFLGSIQKRKRLFTVSIRKDVDDGSFKFIKIKKESPKITEYIRKDIFLPVEDKIQAALIMGEENGFIKIKNATKKGYILSENTDIVDTSFYNSKTRRGRVQKGKVPTLLRSKSVSIIENNRLRYLTPKEYWLMQEMPEELYKKVEECNFTLNEAYDVVGGVINQKHLDCLFYSLRLFLEKNKNFNK